MNREIKFRGKRISNGKWLYGDLMHDTVGGCYVFPIDCAALYKENAILPETIGQYTGLKDKNGKEIYEGDIVLGTNIRIAPYYKEGVFYNGVRDYFKVVYLGERFCFEGKSGSCIGNIFDWEIEVVGNVYDNHELFTK